MTHLDILKITRSIFLPFFNNKLARSATLNLLIRSAILNLLLNFLLNSLFWIWEYKILHSKSFWRHTYHIHHFQLFWLKRPNLPFWIAIKFAILDLLNLSDFLNKWLNSPFCLFEFWTTNLTFRIQNHLFITFAILNPRYQFLEIENNIESFILNP